MPEQASFELEAELWQQGHDIVLGIDEAGRGCLAGPVTAAAVWLPPTGEYPYRDSKQLSHARRAALAERIRGEALAWGVGWAAAAEIDELGVLKATHLAAQRALEATGIGLGGTALVTDYLRLEHPGPVSAVARADQRSWQVAAASILAKTERDAFMCRLARELPAYGFERHKGYGTAQHLQALALHGPCDQHRFSFAPVARTVQQGGEGLQCANEPDFSRG